MKTLQEIKDEVAKEHGFVSWGNLTFIYAGFIQVVQPFNDEVSKRFAIEVAKESLKNASENAFTYFEHKLDEYIIDKDSILNENNIPKL